MLHVVHLRSLRNFPRRCSVESCNSIDSVTKKDRLDFLSSDRDSVLEDKLRVGRVRIDNRARGVERVSCE